MHCCYGITWQTNKHTAVKLQCSFSLQKRPSYAHKLLLLLESEEVVDNLELNNAKKVTCKGRKMRRKANEIPATAKSGIISSEPMLFTLLALLYLIGCCQGIPTWLKQRNQEFKYSFCRWNQFERFQLCERKRTCSCVRGQSICISSINARTASK